MAMRKNTIQYIPLFALFVLSSCVQPKEHKADESTSKKVRCDLFSDDFDLCVSGSSFRKDSNNIYEEVVLEDHIFKRVRRIKVEHGNVIEHRALFDELSHSPVEELILINSKGGVKILFKDQMDLDSLKTDGFYDLRLFSELSIENQNIASITRVQFLVNHEGLIASYSLEENSEFNGRKYSNKVYGENEGLTIGEILFEKYFLYNYILN